VIKQKDNLYTTILENLLLDVLNISLYIESIIEFDPVVTVVSFK